MRDFTLKNRNYALLSTAIILLLWWLAAATVNNSVTIPSPIETIKALMEIITSKYFLLQVLGTLKRALSGFAIAFISGVVFGVLSGVFSPIYYLLRPLVIAQRSVPTMAVILLALIWLDNAIAPILVGVIVIFPIIYGAVVNGVREMDVQLLEMAQIYHLSRKKKLRHLYLPSISSSLRAVAAAAISLNLKITIAAEVLGQANNAIGTGFQLEKVSLNTAGVLAWAMIAILIGWLLETIVGLKFMRLFVKR